MVWFIVGLLVGCFTCAAVAGIAGVLLSRRFRALRDRALAAERAVFQSERLAELGTLTGGLAHEIKNPLSTVQLNLQLLAEDIPPSNPAFARVTNRLATVQREAGRLREILDDFLRYAGKLELDRRPTDLRRTLSELVDFYAPQANLQRVELRLCPGSGSVVASVDERLIKQSILNLMINALQAMPPSGGEILLDARLDPPRPGEAPTASIDVTDTGPGIPPETAEKIFQAYYSTKKGGTGLGLAMSRRIALEHAGTLTLRSEPGKGSVFTLRLPVKVPPV